MDTGLANKVVVITGGASGIGAAMAYEYTKERAKVAVCGRNREKLEEFVAKARNEGLEISGIVCDVADQDSLRKFAVEVVRKYGGIDVWINNAGITVLEHLMKLKIEDWDNVLRTNLTAVFVGSRIAAEYMQKRGGGNIVNISSFTGLIPTANNCAYSVSKAGVLSLTKLLAAELAPFNIRVNAIIPGYIHTEMGDLDIKIKAEEIIKPISLKRFGAPREVGLGAIFLTSEAATYITGEALVISGGKFVVQNAMTPWSWEQ